MNFDWSDYLSLSGDLLSGHDKVTTHQAACWRAIASRSYYAAFHMAQDYCRQSGGGKRWDQLERKFSRNDDTGMSHEIVRRWFVESKIDEEKQIGAWLFDLKLTRKDADYVAQKQINESTAAWAHGQATEIIESLKALSVKE